jgi:vitamin B12 transporter
MQRLVVILAILILAAGAAAEAQEQETKKVEPVVVTATGVETPKEQLGVAITVVDGQDFQTYHYETVDDALRNVPGVEIRRSGSLGKTTSISIRGANSNQVQVLVDGVRVKSPTTGQAELSDLSPDLIERIEIIRGPQSTRYGADAIGGVVNIITKKGTGPFSASVHQEAGNYDTLRSRASFTGTYKLFDYSFSASHLESNGQFKNDGSDIDALNARLGVSLPGNTSAAFIVRYNKTDTGLPVKFVFPPPLPITPIIDPNQKQQSETLVMTLEARTQPVPWWESRARISRYQNSQGFQDAPDPGFPFDVVTISQFNVERREAEWDNSFHLGKWSTTTIGLEYRHEEGDDKGVFRTATHTQAGFFEQQLRFFDRLFLTGGFRVEHHSVFGTVTTERGSLAYLIKEWGTRIRGGAGSGFRAPSINDLFFPGFSNAALQPERSFSYDFGVDQKLWRDRIRLGVTLFHNDFTNLIKFIPIPVFPFASVTNIGRAKSQGMEFTAEADLLANLVATVNYTYTDTEDLVSRHPLPREPQHRWNLGLIWEPVKRLSLFAQVYIVSEQFENFGDIFNRGYTRVDIGGAYRLLTAWGWLQALEATARVQNLLSEHYAEVRGFPALGTNVLVGLRARF